MRVHASCAGQPVANEDNWRKYLGYCRILTAALYILLITRRDRGTGLRRMENEPCQDLPPCRIPVHRAGGCSGILKKNLIGHFSPSFATRLGEMDICMSLLQCPFLSLNLTIGHFGDALKTQCSEVLVANEDYWRLLKKAPEILKHSYCSPLHSPDNSERSRNRSAKDGE
ncbi:MAG: hypothetical protein ACJA2S_001567 [Cyclobacteriaceae bacterium]|jgi:hypothetical protein